MQYTKGTLTTLGLNKQYSNSAPIFSTKSIVYTTSQKPLFDKLGTSFTTFVFDVIGKFEQVDGLRWPKVGLHLLWVGRVFPRLNKAMDLIQQIWSFFHF
jgi:hypothetical protein